ncbi:MAG TPA: hypothetical protein VJY35_12120 [Candidatus Eisenbacteria bacterium]|nr:hypothetical protein [Candidatus Eisenbacteria bacterium]
MSRPLRVGFVVEGFSIPAWQAELMDAVGAEPGFERSLLLVLRGPAAATPSHPIVSAYDAFDRLVDRGRNTRVLPVALEPAGTPVLEWTPPSTARLAEHALDLLIDPGGHDLGPELATATRLGLWTIRFGDDPGHGGELPHLWELDDRHATATLEAQGPAGAARMLARTTCGMHPSSLVRTRCVIAAAIVNLTLGRLRGVRTLGPEFLARASRPMLPPVSRPESPGALRLASLFVVCGLRVARRLWDKAVRDDFYWSVAVAPRPAEPGLEAALHRADFRELPQPPDWFHADPFVYEHEGESFLFVEAFPYATGRGVISVSRIHSDGAFSPPRIVLERPYHLSYPNVFRRRGEIFMIPETSENRTIELYRCERFPDRWALDTVLMENIEAADATIVESAGRLWMFVTIASRGIWLDTELHVFHAEDVRGPWRAHPLNPVVSDVRRARPAGIIWEEKGQLIRPGQDCSPGHARATSFQRITMLTPEDYAEVPFTRLDANQIVWKRNAQRTHHWCMGSRFVAVDATVSRFRRPRVPTRPGGGAWPTSLPLDATREAGSRQASG